jgi:predicted nucleic acid-binding protein
VRAWLNEQVAETLYLTSVTLTGMLFGIAVLPAGRRRNSLTRTLDGLLELFGDRVLPFDADAARHHTALAVAARNAGRGSPTPDGYIAAIAALRGFIVASRDASPYKPGGLLRQPVAKLTTHPPPIAPLTIRTARNISRRFTQIRADAVCWAKDRERSAGPRRGTCRN